MTQCTFPLKARHFAVTPHHVFPPFTMVFATSGPGLLTIAPHVPFVEIPSVLATIAPDVMAFAMHAAIEPGAHVRVSVREDALILHKLVGAHPHGSIEGPGCCCQLVNSLLSNADRVFTIRAIVLAIDVFIWKTQRHLTRTIA